MKEPNTAVQNETAFVAYTDPIPLSHVINDGSVHKNQTNKILVITFPIISKTWSFQKLLAIQTKQFTVTLAATKVFIQLPTNFQNFWQTCGLCKT